MSILIVWLVLFEVLLVFFLCIPFGNSFRVTILNLLDPARKGPSTAANSSASTITAVSNVLLALLGILFLSSVFSYRSAVNEESSSPASREYLHLRVRRLESEEDAIGLFTAIILWIAIGRLASLLKQLNKAEASVLAMANQAKQASAFAQAQMKENSSSSSQEKKSDAATPSSSASSSSVSKEKELSEKVRQLTSDYDSLKKNFSALESQAKAQQDSFGNLQSENSRLKDQVDDFLAVMGPVASKAKKAD